MSKPRILFFDIETSPNLGYTWSKWEVNVIEFVKEWELLSFAYKWQGDKDVHCLARPDFKDKTELSLVKALHRLLDEADVVVGHNSDQFDNKKAKAKFVEHNLPPVSPFTSIDTKKMAKGSFQFNSNSLNDLGQLLKVGKKLKTGGFELWTGCMAGDKASWKTMKEYNKQDVVLLEKVYNRLKVWDTKHPSFSAMEGKTDVCPICGSSNVQNRGYSYTRASRKQRKQCLACRHWYQGSPVRLKSDV